MRVATRSLLATLVFSVYLLGGPVSAVTIQKPTDVLNDGSAYLWVEGESAYELEGGNPQDSTVGWVNVNKTNPIQTISQDANGNAVVSGGLPVLPADTNASGGGALFQNFPAGTTATWKMQFVTPATYYLYAHWSVWNRDTNTNYGNEDSFYLPPAFGADPRNDWVGFEGSNVAGDPVTGDGINDGYIDGFPTFAQNYVDEGAVASHNNTEEHFFEGQYHWYWIDNANDMNAEGGFVSFDGMAIKYEVTEADIGKELVFTINGREPYGSIDGWLFSTAPDLLIENSQETIDGYFLNPDTSLPGDVNGNGSVGADDIDAISAALNAGNAGAEYDVDGNGTADAADRAYLIGTVLNTYLGDSDLNGEFNSGDLVAVFTVGEYEDGVATNSGWSDGDWDGNADFDSGDFVAAFAQGGYEIGPKAAVSSVPEPVSAQLLLIGLLSVAARRRGQR